MTEKLEQLTPEQLGGANGGNPYFAFAAGYLGGKAIDYAYRKFTEPGPRHRGYQERPSHSLDQTGRRRPTDPFYGPKG